MNRTVNANIGRVIFHIDEDAYHKLFNYLDTIKRHFQVTGGGDDIMEDIEARIAEMLQDKTGAKQIVGMKEVDEVIAQMGMPEDFEDAGTEQGSASNKETGYSGPTYAYGEKRFFRNPDDKILGGVCSGISAYFGIDPLWLRLAFVIGVLVFGTGILIYIILWVIIPEAITPAEKLQMRGDKVNISNLEKKIKEEARQFGDRFNSFTSDAKGFTSSSHYRKGQDHVQNFFHDLGNFLKQLIQIIAKIAGVFIVVIGVIILISFFLGLLGITSAFSFSFPVISEYIFHESSLTFLTTLALILLVAVPVIWAITLGIIYLTKSKIRTRFINIGFLLVWLLGLSLGIYSGIRVGMDFRVAAVEKNETIYAIPIPDTLRIEVANMINYDWDREYETYAPWEVNMDNAIFYNDTLRLTSVKVEVENTAGDSLQIIEFYYARGNDRKSAIRRARLIEYKYVLQGNVLRIDPAFQIGKAPFRDQRVKLLIKVPDGIYVSTNDEASFIVDSYDYTYKARNMPVTPADTVSAEI